MKKQCFLLNMAFLMLFFGSLCGVAPGTIQQMKDRLAAGPNTLFHKDDISQVFAKHPDQAFVKRQIVKGGNIAYKLFYAPAEEYQKFLRANRDPAKRREETLAIVWFLYSEAARASKTTDLSQVTMFLRNIGANRLLRFLQSTPASDISVDPKTKVSTIAMPSVTNLPKNTLPVTGAVDITFGVDQVLKWENKEIGATVFFKVEKKKKGFFGGLFGRKKGAETNVSLGDKQIAPPAFFYKDVTAYKNRLTRDRFGNEIATRMAIYEKSVNNPDLADLIQLSKDTQISDAEFYTLFRVFATGDILAQARSGKLFAQRAQRKFETHHVTEEIEESAPMRQAVYESAPVVPKKKLGFLKAGKLKKQMKKVMTDSTREFVAACADLKKRGVSAPPPTLATEIETIINDFRQKWTDKLHPQFEKFVTQQVAALDASLRKKVIIYLRQAKYYEFPERLKQFTQSTLQKLSAVIAPFVETQAEQPKKVGFFKRMTRKVTRAVKIDPFSKFTKELEKTVVDKTDQFVADSSSMLAKGLPRAPNKSFEDQVNSKIHGFEQRLRSKFILLKEMITPEEFAKLEQLLTGVLVNYMKGKITLLIGRLPAEKNQAFLTKLGAFIESLLGEIDTMLTVLVEKLGHKSSVHFEQIHAIASHYLLVSLILRLELVKAMGADPSVIQQLTMWIETNGPPFEEFMRTFHVPDNENAKAIVTSRICEKEKGLVNTFDRMAKGMVWSGRQRR